MKSIDVTPPLVDFSMLDTAVDWLDHSAKYKDIENAEWWLDKAFTECAKIMVVHGDMYIDELYDWVIDHDDDFQPMHKETFEDELDDYISSNLQELWKQYLIHTTNE